MTPAMRAVLAGERSKPGTLTAPGPSMNSSAGAATYAVSCSRRALPTQAATARSYPLSRAFLGLSVTPSLVPSVASALRSSPRPAAAAAFRSSATFRWSTSSSVRPSAMAVSGTGTGADAPMSVPSCPYPRSQDRPRFSFTPVRPCRFRQAPASSSSARRAFSSVGVASAAPLIARHFSSTERSVASLTNWTRGRPLGLRTTSAAMPTSARHPTLRAVALRRTARSFAGSRNGPTARGSTRSAPTGTASGTSTVSTDSGSTTAEACDGSEAVDAEDGADESPPVWAESRSGRRSSVVSTMRRPDCWASFRTVASAPAQSGWPAA